MISVREVIYSMQKIRYDEPVFLENKETDWAYVMLEYNPELAITSIIIHNAVVYTVAIYCIRKQSKR